MAARRSSRHHGTGWIGLGLLVCLQGVRAQAATLPPAERCSQLAAIMSGHWPDPSTRLLSATREASGPHVPPAAPGAPPQPTVILPDHCDVQGVLHERTGVAAEHYAIHFHLRLPTPWNGGFFYQGGGGSNGVVGDALGTIAAGIAPAITQGFAVVSQDTGHDNATNSDPARGGSVAFGFDPQARADYGHASLRVVADTAKAVIAAYYGKAPRYSYFVGCSKGGQEGMTFAERYPDEFDGIVAAAPGFSLPRAAVAEAWDVQAVAAVVQAAGEQRLPSGGLASAFTDADLTLVADAILSVCDADDGLKDGMVGAPALCTAPRVLPALDARTCAGPKTDLCLAAPQIQALKRIYAGPVDARGKALYSDWQWDPGIAGAGWRLWKLGSADGRVPALNVALGGASLAAVFSTPPLPVPADLPSTAEFQLRFAVERDAATIYAAAPPFTRSAWQDISARSSDLRRFIAHGGKMIVPHGVADPVFSIHDTLAWYAEVRHRAGGNAAASIRVFPVPGMAHCSGGPATDHFNAFAALQGWVEEHRAPEQILATAGAASPWPGRTRPLCAYPRVARYKGSGDVEAAESFVCR